MPEEPPVSRLSARLVHDFGCLISRRYILEAVVAGIFLVLGCVFGGARYGCVVLRGATTTGTLVGFETNKSRTRQQPLQHTHTNLALVALRSRITSGRW
jgi:hypothetical protein